jgi:hypothetical protein
LQFDRARTSETWTEQTLPKCFLADTAWRYYAVSGYGNAMSGALHVKTGRFERLFNF